MLKLLKRFFEINFFFANILLPALVLALYCWSFTFISSQFMLKGVNYDFTSKLGKYILYFVIGAMLVFILLMTTDRGGKLSFKFTPEKYFITDALLLLLPLTPIVQYILVNNAILSVKESFYVIALSLLVFGIYTFAIPMVLRVFMPTRTTLIVGLAFVFTLASMALLSKYFSWFEVGELQKSVALFVGTFFVVWLFLYFSDKKTLYIFIALVFILNSLSIYFSLKDEKASSVFSSENMKILTQIDKQEPIASPNIYLLIYDAYVSNETMLAYGIDNSAQEEYLVSQGFQLYPHIYSIGADSIASMSRTLNASSEYYGASRRAVSGDGLTQFVLRNLGYETYGLFPYDYMFLGVGESYDYSFPQGIDVSSSNQLLKAIFLGEFRFDVSFVKRDEFIEAKQAVFKDPFKHQVFIYAHSDRPSHSQNSGACLANETELYMERLQEANIEMKQDLDLIIENDPNAIIIVAGDHGPYLTKNCISTTGFYDTSEISRLDIQDRYGTFLAIRWPTGDFVKYDDITVLQDLFPSVFAYLYQDPKILEYKIEPIIGGSNSISDVTVNNGIISGGVDDGEPLFQSDK